MLPYQTCHGLVPTDSRGALLTMRRLVECSPQGKEGLRWLVSGIEGQRSLRAIGLLLLVALDSIEPRMGIGHAPGKHSFHGPTLEGTVKINTVGLGYRWVSHSHVVILDVVVGHVKFGQINLQTHALHCIDKLTQTLPIGCIGAGRNV